MDNSSFHNTLGLVKHSGFVGSYSTTTNESMPFLIKGANTVGFYYTSSSGMYWDDEPTTKSSNNNTNSMLGLMPVSITLGTVVMAETTIQTCTKTSKKSWE